MLLGDANAKVGECTCAAIGTHFPQPENEAGGFLRALCTAESLTLPQTFPELARPGEVATWRSKTGTAHRIDYIAVPQGSAVEPASFGPEPTVDISSGTIDHSLVVGSFTFKASPAAALVQRRKPLGDRLSVSQPVRASIVSQAMAAVPVFPWRLNSSDALACLNTFARAVYQAVAPNRAVRKRKHWISEQTLQLIQHRASFRRRSDTLSAQAHTQWCKHVLQCWRGVVAPHTLPPSSPVPVHA